MSAQHTPMVVKAARALCKRGADLCKVDFEDSWKLYGDDYLADAQAALDAAGAPELLSLLVDASEQLPIAAVGWNTREAGDEDRTVADFHVPRVIDLIARTKAAIAAATGSAS